MIWNNDAKVQNNGDIQKIEHLGLNKESGKGFLSCFCIFAT